MVSEIRKVLTPLRDVRVSYQVNVLDLDRSSDAYLKRLAGRGLLPESGDWMPGNWGLLEVPKSRNETPLLSRLRNIKVKLWLYKKPVEPSRFNYLRSACTDAKDPLCPDLSLSPEISARNPPRLWFSSVRCGLVVAAWDLPIGPMNNLGRILSFDDLIGAQAIALPIEVMTDLLDFSPELPKMTIERIEIKVPDRPSVVIPAAKCTQLPQGSPQALYACVVRIAGEPRGPE